eukprot:Rhum_TRINITY_DN18691_c0_g1::Rhum_TRINITY_DN18691_c0_g1_i1::g.168130::m.168130
MNCEQARWPRRLLFAAERSHQVGGGRARLRLHLQYARDGRLTPRRDARRELRVHNVSHVAESKAAVAEGKLVEDATQGPDVVRGAVALSLEDLGSHVEHGAAHGHGGVLLRVHLLHKTEVTDLDCRLVLPSGEENVVRLQVTVEKTAPVQVLDGEARLQKNVSNVFPRAASALSALLHEATQVAASAKLGDDDDGLHPLHLLPVRIDIAHNVRVLVRLKHLRLEENLLHALLELRTRLLRLHLGHLLDELLTGVMVTEEHVTERALANLPDVDVLFALRRRDLLRHLAGGVSAGRPALRCVREPLVELGELDHARPIGVHLHEHLLRLVCLNTQLTLHLRLRQSNTQLVGVNVSTAVHVNVVEQPLRLAENPELILGNVTALVPVEEREKLLCHVRGPAELQLHFPVVAQRLDELVLGDGAAPVGVDPSEDSVGDRRVVTERLEGLRERCSGKVPEELNKGHGARAVGVDLAEEGGGQMRRNGQLLRNNPVRLQGVLQLVRVDATAVVVVDERKELEHLVVPRKHVGCQAAAARREQLQQLLARAGPPELALDFVILQSGGEFKGADATAVVGVHQREHLRCMCFEGRRHCPPRNEVQIL